MKEDTWETLGDAIAKALNKAISELAAELDDEEEGEDTISTENVKSVLRKRGKNVKSVSPPTRFVTSQLLTMTAKKMTVPSFTPKKGRERARMQLMLCAMRLAK